MSRQARSCPSWRRARTPSPNSSCSRTASSARAAVPAPPSRRRVRRTSAAAAGSTRSTPRSAATCRGSSTGARSACAGSARWRRTGWATPVPSSAWTRRSGTPTSWATPTPSSGRSSANAWRTAGTWSNSTSATRTRRDSRRRWRASRSRCPAEADFKEHIMTSTFAGLPVADPEELGFHPDRLDRIATLMDAASAAHDVPGTATVVLRHGKVAHTHVAGRMDTEREAPVSVDSLFRMYSQTKPVTAAVVMSLFEDGAFHLNEPVSKWLPEFENPQVVDYPAAGDQVRGGGGGRAPRTPAGRRGARGGRRGEG
ncbi:MAG: serine hydrolase, partial [Gammaproteobacteria bacterium]|nr:serine hydrolase [Gammaproteobacteria bacterium]